MKNASQTVSVRNRRKGLEKPARKNGNGDKQNAAGE
jgi:hypothetical protein